MNRINDYHYICADCGHDVIRPSIVNESLGELNTSTKGTRYKKCEQCGRSTLIVHDAMMCMIARKHCPDWIAANKEMLDKVGTW